VCYQVFFGILVQHFANLAGRVPLPMDLLDALTVHLLDFTSEVPFYAATVAQARLKRLQQRLSSALKDPVSGLTCATCLVHARSLAPLEACDGRRNKKPCVAEEVFRSCGCAS
jgi:hypothetical protein